MTTIWKYPLEITDRQTLALPIDARFLYVGEQFHRLCVWALVDPSRSVVKHSIRIIGTGHTAPDDPNAKYIGSAITEGGDLVWHVFDLGEVQP